MRQIDEIKTILGEDLKEYFMSKKVFFLIAISLFSLIIINASSILQLMYLMFFKERGALPFTISITYYLLFFIIPIFSILIGHDSISQEKEKKTIRGIASKTKRSSIIIARSLSNMVMIGIISFTLMVVSSVHTYVKFSIVHITAPIMLSMYLIVYGGAISSIVVFFSTSFRRSSTSLFAGILFFVFEIYLAVGKLNWISVFGYMNNVLTKNILSDLKLIIFPIVTYLIYLTISLLSSLYIFQRKDL